MSRYVKICQDMSRYVNGTCLKNLKMPCGHACQDLYKAEGLDLQASCHGYTIDFFAKGICFFLSFMFYAAKVLGLHAATALLREWRTLDKARAGTAGTAFRGQIPRDPENS